MKKAVKKALALALAAVLALGGTQASVYAATNSPATSVTTVKKDDVTSAAAASGVKFVANTRVNGNTTVTSVKNASKKTTVTVPSKITVSGVKYTVTNIGAETFKNATKATKVVIPATVKRINKKGFTSLSKTVKTIQFNTTTAPVVAKTAFKGTSTKNLTITVSSKMSAKELKKFKKALTAAGFKGTVKQSK